MFSSSLFIFINLSSLYFLVYYAFFLFLSFHFFYLFSLFSLLNRGCNYNFQDNLGRNAVHYAVMSGDVNCVEALISVGTMYDIPDLTGKRAIHYAAEGNSIFFFLFFSFILFLIYPKTSYTLYRRLLYSISFSICPNSRKLAIYYASMAIFHFFL